MTFWQVKNDNGDIIAQYEQEDKPKTPKNHGLGWNVREVSKDHLINNVQWWFDS